VFSKRAFCIRAEKNDADTVVFFFHLRSEFTDDFYNLFFSICLISFFLSIQSFANSRVH
jgi:hypothetical protein